MPLIEGKFVLRYEADDPGDGLPAGEGAFLECSFALVDNTPSAVDRSCARHTVAGVRE
jgi:hypothetical protein